MKLTVALVGCGAMGSALLKGWLTLPDTQSTFESFWVIAPHREKVEPFFCDSRVQWFLSPNELPSCPDVLVFAVKPFMLEEILPNYRSFKSLFISVIAGKPLKLYETLLSPTLPILRTMPNTPVAIHQGVIGLFANKNVTQSQKEIIDVCFQGLGYCSWVQNEEELDKITAISGSGPAYVFYMIESLAKGAESLGFDKTLALQLAYHTFVGASTYALQAKEDPHVLCQHVSSNPKGTTAAALDVIEAGNIRFVIEDAVKAAYNRAQEIAK
ncbi:MAG: pyrroline-5-carboxylate reductase [Alphaproteobacteria bacterium]|nr:pyrroline-5-carboxylate reductase [Alphaproteobacteria bacterium]